MDNARAGGAYRIERLNARNLADVEDLHAAVYGRRRPPGFFAQKYDTRFTGLQHIGFIAYDGPTPAAFYGVLPCFLRIDGETVLSAQSADTMTHPQHRYKGLFVDLASATFQLCRDLDIRLLFGFPNQNSLPGLVGRLQWQNPAVMDHFVIPSAGPGLARLARRAPLLRDLGAPHWRRRLARYASDRSSIGNSVLADGFGGIMRDPAWFTYKTYSRTDIIEIAGSTLWIKVGTMLWIGDAETRADAFEEMMRELRQLAAALGIAEIYFHACPGTTLHRLFARHFAPTPSFSIVFKAFDERLPIDRIKFTSADIDIF